MAFKIKSIHLIPKIKKDNPNYNRKIFLDSMEIVMIDFSSATNEKDVLNLIRSRVGYNIDRYNVEIKT